MKQGNAVFAFTLKNEAGETESWHIDLKEQGDVAQGLGTKPTGEGAPLAWKRKRIAVQAADPGRPRQVTLLLSDKDFGDLVAGKANAQRLFMSGKL